MRLGLATSCAFPVIKPTWLDAVPYIYNRLSSCESRSVSITL